MSNEAQAVLGRIVYSGKVVYCVKWKGLPIESSTWESVKVLKQEPYKQLVKEFNDTHKNDKDCSEILKIVPYVDKKRRGRPPAKNKVNKPKVNKVKKNDSNELFFDDDEVKKEDYQEQLKLKKEEFDESTKIVSNQVGQANEAKQNSTDASQEEAQQAHQEENMAQVTVQAAEMTLATSMTEPNKKEKKQVKGIHYIGKSSDNKDNYVVEFADGSLLKCNREELKEKYLSKYVRFQEHILKSRPKKE